MFDQVLNTNEEAATKRCRSLQDIFKMYNQVRLFLLKRFQNYFETYSKGF